MTTKKPKSKRTVKRRTSPTCCSVYLDAHKWKVVCEIMEWSLLEWKKEYAGNSKALANLAELMELPLEIRRQLEPTQNANAEAHGRAVASDALFGFSVKCKRIADENGLYGSAWGLYEFEINGVKMRRPCRDDQHPLRGLGRLLMDRDFKALVNSVKSNPNVKGEG